MLVRTLAAYTIIIEGGILFALIAGRRKTPDIEFKHYPVAPDQPHILRRRR